MKAAVLEHYDEAGADPVVRDVPMPHVGVNDVLAHMAYADVNPLDNMIIRKEVKLIVDYSTPLVMGNEFVGTIESVRDGVFSLDEVNAALQKVRAGGSKGKTILKIA